MLLYLEVKLQYIIEFELMIGIRAVCHVLAQLATLLGIFFGPEPDLKFNQASMMCAGLTADELKAVDAVEEYRKYLRGDTGTGDSGKSAG